MFSCARGCLGPLPGKPCPACGKAIRRGREISKDAGGCGKVFCDRCCSHALVPASEEPKGDEAVVSLFCKSCFKRNNLLDFSKAVDVFGPAQGEAPCILFVHGILNCRTSFREHAKQLSERHGFRCVLMDLPGHGARMDDEDITLAGALGAIEAAVEEHCVNAAGMPTYVLGMSLGGILTMGMLGHRPDLVAGAIVVECNFNIGAGRDLKNRLRFWAARQAFGCIAFMTEEKIVEHFRKGWKGSGHISTDMSMGCLLRTGVFPRPVNAFVAMTGCVDLLGSLRGFKGPVHFIQVSKGDEG
eukprot:CAMPEP_0179358544 /NCGR_PEP_ID=MMETSP0797-20121207/78983_1 /TAXON_ID=47934 /ORGANISM="Dinophysis acuminata, Strain DAEP01" /LENGTH=299 /DNA_ID=CAMNT_0021073805 /DNA_START=34 /DNA_END=929 /DNA_ORIENTATION=-